MTTLQATPGFNEITNGFKFGSPKECETAKIVDQISVKPGVKK